MPKTNKKESKENVVPVRFTDRALAEVKVAASAMGPRQSAEIIRLAAEIGLAVLAEVKYDLAGIIARYSLAQVPIKPAIAVPRPRLGREREAQTRLIKAVGAGAAGTPVPRSRRQPESASVS